MTTNRQRNRWCPFFFGDPHHRRHDRGLEHPDFDLEFIVSPIIWLCERRTSTVQLFAHAKTGRSIGGLSCLNRNVWPPYLVIIAVCYKRPGFAFRKMASLPMMYIYIYIYTYIVFHKYHYFLQETGRLSSLTNSINLYSLCCTFASSSHPISYPADIL